VSYPITEEVALELERAPNLPAVVQAAMPMIQRAMRKAIEKQEKWLEKERQAKMAAQRRQEQLEIARREKLAHELGRQWARVMLASTGVRA
jgi:ParB-like chromosome segregation protein Spo0J